MDAIPESRMLQRGAVRSSGSARGGDYNVVHTVQQNSLRFIQVVFFKKKGYTRHTVMNNPKIYPEVRNSRRPGNRERCSSSPTCLVQALAMPAVGFSVPSNARDESNQFFPFTNWRNKREPGKIETMDDRLSDRPQALEMIGNWPAIIQAVKWKECLLLWEAEMLVIAVRKSLLHDKKIIIIIEGVVTVV